MNILLFVLFSVQSGLMVTPAILAVVPSGHISTETTLSILPAMADFATPVLSFGAILPAIATPESIWFQMMNIVLIYMVVVPIFVWPA